MARYTLMVDDDEILIFILDKLINITEFATSPLAFENGKTALDFMREHYTENDSFVIFLDINMPVMNGWEFLDAIIPFTKPENTFVYILTSSIDKSDREKAAGYKHVRRYLTKPFDQEILISLKKEIPA